MNTEEKTMKGSDLQAAMSEMGTPKVPEGHEELPFYITRGYGGDSWMQINKEQMKIVDKFWPKVTIGGHAEVGQTISGMMDMTFSQFMDAMTYYYGIPAMYDSPSIAGSILDKPTFISFDTRGNVKQAAAAAAWKDDTTRAICYAGGKSSGKDFLGASLIFFNAITYPGTIWFIASGDFNNLLKFKRTSIEEVMEIWGYDKSFYPFNSAFNFYELNNGSKVYLIDAGFKDSDPEYKNLQDLSFTGGWIADAQSMERDAADHLEASVGLNLNEVYNIHPKVLYTCLPNTGFTYLKFYKPNKEGNLPAELFFVQAYPSDNKDVPKGYILGLRKILNKQQQASMIDGEWDALFEEVESETATSFPIPKFGEDLFGQPVLQDQDLNPETIMVLGFQEAAEGSFTLKYFGKHFRLVPKHDGYIFIHEEHKWMVYWVKSLCDSIDVVMGNKDVLYDVNVNKFNNSAPQEILPISEYDSRILIEGFQIKSYDKFLIFCQCLDTLEKECGIRVVKLEFNNVFVCPDIELDSLKTLGTPMQKLIAGCVVDGEIKDPGGNIQDPVGK